MTQLVPEASLRTSAIAARSSFSFVKLTPPLCLLTPAFTKEGPDLAPVWGDLGAWEAELWKRDEKGGMV